jgi:hypothetical protein
MNELEFTLLQDSVFNRKFYVQTSWNPGGKYLFVADSASVKDVYGLTNDSIGKSFSVKTIESYGLLLVDIGEPTKDWLVQLLNSKGNVIRQKYAPKSGKLAFQYIRPGKYNLRIVVDKNKNAQWDAGKYADKKQPEMVIYYPDVVNVRANWDVVVPWNPQDFDLYDFVKKNRKPKKRK